jgi:predicted Zn-dependent peptidase
LHRRLVRDERIAQDVALFTLGFIGGASVAAGWATARPGIPVERVEAAFHEELERLAVEPVSDDELARARALIEADELGALQRVEERADRLSMYATLFDRPALINEMLERYLAVTPEAILEAAAATFRPDNRLVLTYLPETPPAESEAIDGEARDDADEEVAA